MTTALSSMTTQRAVCEYICMDSSWLTPLHSLVSQSCSANHCSMTICVGPLTHYLRVTAQELATHECTPTAAGARVNPAPSLAGQNCIANHYSMTICRSLNTKIQPLSWLHMITYQQQLVKGLVVQPQSYVTQFINNGTFQALAVLLQKSTIYASLCVPPLPHSHSLLSQGSKVFSTSEPLTRTFHLRRCWRSRVQHSFFTPCRERSVQKRSTPS